ncbi:hypothetical protein BLA60_14285 [Actinophytocola xinjiangensis]|uniref:Prevent-host-death family protein n=1 Tax=Actinophytocola xinjiangensis TaxID=485602 RepID=A0A7Z1AYY2_9PSEU|nr:hypothetical protein [Actinophytocola xinjiangensis]OLF11152.1 hypothetical protein BLA60_14285 [Actinophytocola xinjiangensis]
MTTEVQWSELQRDPKAVAALADQGDVRVRRRDGAALLLIRADRASRSAAGAVQAARALRSLVEHLPPEAHEAIARSLIDAFPWVDVLPPDDQRQFVADFTRAFQISAELGQWSPLEQTIAEWHTTATVHAAPELAASLSTPLNDDLGPVASPFES